MSQYFSRMRTRDGIPPTVPAGTWQQNTYLTLLSTFAANLDVSSVSTGSDFLNSIPVPWARMILFENALFDSRHPSHIEVVSQWRGILGLIALAGPLGLNIDFKAIDLARYDNSKITKAFRDLQPKGDNVNTWNAFQMLTVNGEIVGATSPRTLVFTGVSHSCPASVPFSENGKLTDPVAYYRRFNDSLYLSLLSAWLTEFVGVIQNSSAMEAVLGTFPVAEGGMPVTRKSRLIQSLNQWKSEIGQPPPYDVNGQWKRIFTLNPYSEIPGISEIAQGSESDLFSQNRKVIVGYKTDAGSKIYNNRNQPLNGEPLLVYNGRWIEANRPLPLPFDFIPKEIKTIEDPAIFFEQTLLEVDLPKTPEAVYYLQVQNSDETISRYLFPFKPEILDYFSPEEISANTVIGKHPENDSLIVELKFPLVNNRVIRTWREYKRDQIHAPYSDELAKWPDFVCPEWNYYLYYRKEVVGQLNFEPRGDVIRRGWVDQYNYECMLSSEPVNSFVGTYGNFSGLLLLRENHITAPKEYWKVGIDFGSTHTRAFYRKAQKQEDDFISAGDIYPITFKPRAKELTFCSGEINEHFPDRSEEGNKNWSLEQEELNTRLILPAQNNRPFDEWLPREGSVYKLPAKNGSSVSLKEDLKWNNNQDNYDMRSFLRSLLMMTEAEAIVQGARIVSFRHTYPSVFTPGLRAKHNGEWNSLQEFINKRRPAELERVSIPTADISETVAVCRHLALGQGASPSSNTISLDVGGSTTDIAVWAKNELQLQESVKLSAGVVGKYLQSDKAADFIEWLTGVVTVEPFNKKQFGLQSAKTNPASNFNDLLSTFTWSRDPDAPKLRDLILTVVNQDEISRAFLSHIVFVFSGLLYYAGILVRRQNLRVNNSEFNLYFCGRGGKLIEWITDDDNPELYHLLVRDMFMAGLNGPKPDATKEAAENEPGEKQTAPEIITKISRYPKEEVGRGLLVESDLKGQQKTTFMTGKKNTVTCGETGYTGLNWDSELTAEILMNLKSEELPEMKALTELSTFIDAFCEADSTSEAAKVLKIREISPATFQGRLRERLFGKGKGSVVTDLHNNKDEALVEPLFITEIKVLLETATNNPKLFAND